MLRWVVVLAVASGQRCLLQPRPCAVRENVLVLRNQTEAGLGDRQYLFSKIALWADALCAHLVVDDPSTMLAPVHNDGLRVPESRQWSDYFFATTGDGDELFKNLSAVTEDHEVIYRANFQELLERKRKFVWYLDESFYPGLMPKKVPQVWNLVENELKNCTRPLVRMLNVDQNPLAMEALRAFQIKTPIDKKKKRDKAPLVTLHVRRTDSIFKCDTSVPLVVAGVACAIREKFTNFARPFHFLLFTDDTDATYLESLKHALTVDAFPDSTFVHGDPIVTSILKSAGYAHDNYLTFLTERPLRRQADLDVAFEHNASGTCASSTTCVKSFYLS